MILRLHLVLSSDDFSGPDLISMPPANESAPCLRPSCRVRSAKHVDRQVSPIRCRASILTHSVSRSAAPRREALPFLPVKTSPITDCSTRHPLSTAHSSASSHGPLHDTVLDALRVDYGPYLSLLQLCDEARHLSFLAKLLPSPIARRAAPCPLCTGPGVPAPISPWVAIRHCPGYRESIATPPDTASASDEGAAQAIAGFLTSQTLFARHTHKASCGFAGGCCRVYCTAQN